MHLPTFGRFDRQSQASADKRSHNEATPRQREIPCMAALASPRLLDHQTLQRITFNGAMADAARGSGMDDCQIAAGIHVCAGYMSRLMRGLAQQWARRIVAYCHVTQCLGPLQVMAHMAGCDLVPRDARAAEVAALKARLLEIEQGRAAA